MKSKLKSIVAGTLGIGFSVFAVYILSQKIDFAKSWELLSKVNPALLILMMGIYLLSFLFRSWRIQLMLNQHHQASFRSVFKSILVGFAGNNMLPARGGEVLRMEYLTQQTGIARMSSLTYVLTEKIFDGLALLGIMALSLWLAPGDLLRFEWLDDMVWLVAGIFGGALLAVLLLRFLFPWVQSRFQTHPSSLVQKLLTLANTIFQAISFVKWNGRSAAVVGLSLMVWLAEGGTFVVGLMALVPQIPPLWTGLLCMVVVNFGLLVPSSPAYVGVFQAMAILALSLFQVDQEQALAYGMLVHLSQFLPITFWGLAYIIPFMLKWKWKP